MPFPVVTLPGTVRGISLLAYRRDLQEYLGTTLVTTVGATASSFDATRQIIADDLRDDEDARSRFAGTYVYVVDGVQKGNQRRILTEGYEGPLGSLLVSRPFAAALAGGTQIELTRPLPVEKHLDVPGLNDIVNEALGQQWIEARLALVGAGGYSYSLDGYPWLSHQDQIIGPVDTTYAPTGGNARTAATSWRLRQQGDAAVLETDLAYSSGQAFQLRVYRPANTYIRSAGTWVSSTVGLTDDAHEARAPLHMVRAIGLTRAYSHLMTRALHDRDPALKLYEKEYARWGRAAARLKWTDLARETSPEPLVHGGGYFPGTKGLWP